MLTIIRQCAGLTFLGARLLNIKILCPLCMYRLKEIETFWQEYYFYYVGVQNTSLDFQRLKLALPRGLILIYIDLYRSFCVRSVSLEQVERN
jgi:hypothetical protein